MSDTYRAVLLPLIPAAALRDAEARVYDKPSCAGWYFSGDGYCALGAIWSALYPDKPYRLANPRDLLPRGRGHRFRRAAFALRRIVEANDAGQLGVPGGLTALLDQEYRAVIR